MMCLHSTEVPYLVRDLDSDNLVLPAWDDATKGQNKAGGGCVGFGESKRPHVIEAKQTAQMQKVI